MRKLILTFLVLLTLTACTKQVVTPSTPNSEGDNLITKEYIDENIYNFNLDLSDLGLTKVPDFSEIATAVQKEDILYLNLSNNQITEISDDLLALPNLKELKIDNNQIKKLENIENIAMLRSIEAYKNQIEEIDLGNLPALTQLDLAYNNLESDDLTQISLLTSLEYLQIQHNQINSIAGIDALENLKKLRIESNQIKNVAVLANLENLTEVTMGNNPLPESELNKWKEFNQANKNGNY